MIVNLEALTFNFKAISFLLKNPKLWKYCFAPLLISVIVMMGILYLMFVGFQNLSVTPGTEQEPTGVMAIIHWLQAYLLNGLLKWVVFFILALFCVWYGFSVIASILLFPFLEFLSNEVEKELRGKELNNPWHAGIIGSLFFSMILLLFKLTFLVVGFFISIVFPPFAIINFFIVSGFCSTESVDYCMSRNLYSISEKLKFLFKHKFSLLSLGSFSAILLLVPFLGLLQPMLAVVSGAMFFVSKTPELGISEKYKDLLNQK